MDIEHDELCVGRGCHPGVDGAGWENEDSDVESSAFLVSAS